MTVPPPRPGETDEYRMRINAPGELDDLRELLDPGDPPRRVKTFGLVLFLIPFAASFYVGYLGESIVFPIIFSALESIFAVWTGWRQGGPLKSWILGTIFSAIVFIPLYFAGLWFGGK